jgi:hypothetical protein
VNDQELHGNAFGEVIAIIDKARENAFRAVNRELINMYWNIGDYVSRRIAEGGWGKSVVKEFSAFIQSRYVGIKGFSPQNIWRMKQFFETYQGNAKLSPLVREISWTNNVEYALSRSMSPALVADYKLHLPDKKVLENKLRELAELAEITDDEDEAL